MKKLIFVLVLCVSLTIPALAISSNEIQYDYEAMGKTIVFSKNTNYTPEERQYIADIIAYGTFNDSSASTYAWCWLTGHDYQYEYVYAIDHKISPDVPRCFETTYRVETCTKCDHSEITDLGGVYIDCCPEE